MTQPTKAIDEMEAAARQHAQSLITPISLTASPEYSFIAGWQKCSEAQDKRIERLTRHLEKAQQFIHERFCMEHEVLATSHCMECDQARYALNEILHTRFLCYASKRCT